MYPQVFGKYVLERELARGGMARVVLATLRGAGGFEKKLVVKQIRDELAFDSEWVRRFVEEAKTTVSLSHPNIVPVYELGVEQGTYFLAMELVEGVTVAELLKNGGVLSSEEGAYIGVEVCRALDYAHRRMDVVHRDITPRNVMVDEEGQVKVIDFGIAAPSEVAGHEVFGSPGHMPPEQIAGDSLGPPTDIFAVAVTLLEAWSGKAPFRRKTPALCEEAMRGPRPAERGGPVSRAARRALRTRDRARPGGAPSERRRAGQRAPEIPLRRGHGRHRAHDRRAGAGRAGEGDRESARRDGSLRSLASAEPRRRGNEDVCGEAGGGRLDAAEADPPDTGDSDHHDQPGDAQTPAERPAAPRAP